jgi:hypothetical protein
MSRVPDEGKKKNVHLSYKKEFQVLPKKASLGKEDKR